MTEARKRGRPAKRAPNRKPKEPKQLTEQERKEAAKLLLELQKRNARKNYLDYCKYAIPNFKVGKHIKYIAPRVEQLIDSELTHKGKKVQILIVSLPPQHGKLLSHDTDILTTKGWKKHGDLSVGEHVFGRDGKHKRIVATSKEDYAEYLVEFTDGTKVKTHGNHEWIVYDRSSHKEKKITTRDIYNSDYYNGRCRFQVDANVCVTFKEKKTPLEPYVFGLWLGDGSTNKTCISHSPNDIESIKKITSYGYAISSQSQHKDTGVLSTYLNGIRKPLKKSGFLKGESKYIPDIYKFNSVENRLELLAGFIDSDGYVYKKNGRITLSNTNKKLINDLHDVVVSLGFKDCICEYAPKVSTSGIVGKQTVYQLSFNPDIEIPTALERKKTKITNPLKRKRGIKEVRPIKKELGKCIQVEDGVYLVGKNLIPTHNSTLITETLPSYYLGRNPQGRVIEASYNESFAGKFGKRNKQKIIQYGEELFGIKLSKGSTSNTEFELDNNIGGMISRGIMSGITGNPADLIIIDDPIKNAQEADSVTYRENVWDEFLSSIMSRLSAKGKIVLIMTRWHEDDLAGRILENTNFASMEINIPLEAEENDVLDRKQGDSLFPEIGKNKVWLKDFKNMYINDPTGSGQRAWDALMQGRPTSMQGNMLKRHWWKYWQPKGMDLPPVNVKIDDEVIQIHPVTLPDTFDFGLQSWDMAFKKTDTSDFVVGQLWHNKGASVFLLDQVKKRMGFVDTVKSVEEFSKKHDKVKLKLIEDKANGSAVIDTLQYKVGGILPINPEGSKEARVSAVSIMIETGNVYLPHPKIYSWVNQFIEEAAQFPKGKHDDSIDAMSQALTRFMYSKNPTKAIEYEYPEEDFEDYYEEEIGFYD